MESKGKRRSNRLAEAVSDKITDIVRKVPNNDVTTIERALSTIENDMDRVPIQDHLDFFAKMMNVLNPEARSRVAESYMMNMSNVLVTHAQMRLIEQQAKLIDAKSGYVDAKTRKHNEKLNRTIKLKYLDIYEYVIQVSMPLLIATAAATIGNYSLSNIETIISNVFTTDVCMITTPGYLYGKDVTRADTVLCYAYFFLVGKFDPITQFLSKLSGAAVNVFINIITLAIFFLVFAMMLYKTTYGGRR